MSFHFRHLKIFILCGIIIGIFFLIRFYDSNFKDANIDANQSQVSASSISPFHPNALRGVLQYHNDASLTGQNLNETQLTPLTVKTRFGKKFSYAVDGEIYAQPLYVSNVNIQGKGLHNVVYVATQHDSVYAFDADGKNPEPLWHVSFLLPGHGALPGTRITTIPTGDAYKTFFDIKPEIGITGTPVIDPLTGRLYVVASTKENGKWITRLHMLNIFNGVEMAAPTTIAASVSGKDWWATPKTGLQRFEGDHVDFIPVRSNQRSALVLAEGLVYVAFASHEDQAPFHGWLFGFDQTTLRQLVVWNTTPNGGGAGIWMSGAGPVVDEAGNLYCTTGNGDFDQSKLQWDWGESVLKIHGSKKGIYVMDYFTPLNQKYLNDKDFDLGSGGILRLPDGTLVTGGKQGYLYHIDPKNMGKYDPASNHVLQVLSNSVVNGVENHKDAQDGIHDGPGIMSTPTYFNNTIYVIAGGDVLKAFRIENGKIIASAASLSSKPFPVPGATVSVSANGNKNGIVWALRADKEKESDAALEAYDASDVSKLLYSSDANPKDKAGPAIKFSVPTIYNGNVYVGTGNALVVYGLH